LNLKNVSERSFFDSPRYSPCAIYNVTKGRSRGIFPAVLHPFRSLLVAAVSGLSSLGPAFCSLVDHRFSFPGRCFFGRSLFLTVVSQTALFTYSVAWASFRWFSPSSSTPNWAASLVILVRRHYYSYPSINLCPVQQNSLRAALWPSMFDPSTFVMPLTFLSLAHFERMLPMRPTHSSPSFFAIPMLD